MVHSSVSAGQLPPPVTLSSSTQNLWQPQEALRMVLGHSALGKAGRCGEKAGASVSKDNLCVALRAKTQGVLPASSPVPDHATGFTGRCWFVSACNGV